MSTRRRRTGGLFGRREGAAEPPHAAIGNGSSEPETEAAGRPQPWLDPAGQPRVQHYGRSVRAERKATRPQDEPDAAAEPTQPIATPAAETVTTTHGSADVRPARAPVNPAGPAAAAAPARAERPPLVGPLEAFLRRPITTLLPLVLLLAGAIYLGLEREPTYTSEARINVGRADVPAYTLQGVVAGNTQLAGSYALTIGAAPVAEQAARDTGLTPAEASGRLGATLVPGSTLIQVDAEGPSSDQAIELANAGAQALIDYVTEVNRNTEGRRLFRQYREAQREVQRIQRRVERLARRNGRAAREELGRAQISLDAAQLRASSLANLYRNASIEPATTSPLTLIAPAAKADSDRREVMEQMIIVAAAAGLVLGLGFALLRANWARLRALRGR